MNRERRFSGKTIDHERDADRLSKQYDYVFAVMRDGRPRTLSDIRRDVIRRYDLAVPLQSVSARLRDMRKDRFGAHTVERGYISNGLWQYQLLVRKRRSQ